MVGFPWGFMAEASVSVEYVRAILEGMVAFGMDPKVFCRQCPALGLDPDKLPASVPIEQWARLLKQVVTYSGDPEMPTKLAENMRPYQLGMLGFLLMTCQTLGDVVHALGQYELLLDGLNDTRVELHPHGVELHWVALTPSPAPVFMKMALTTWMVMARFLTQRHDAVAQACFACTPPADTALYDRIFGLPVLFNQGKTSLYFPHEYMAFPISQGNAQMNDLLKAEANIQMGRLNPHLYMVQALEAAILNTPAQSRADVGTLAATLNMSKRTLQYRLEGMGMTYRKFVDAVRCRQAESLLRDPDRSLSDIAASLGFSDQSGFQHAFKRWRGLSPGDFRRQSKSIDEDGGP